MRRNRKRSAQKFPEIEATRGDPWCWDPHRKLVFPTCARLFLLPGRVAATVQGIGPPASSAAAAVLSYLEMPLSGTDARDP